MSSEVLREDFLQRMRNTSLALAEFSRVSTQSITDQEIGDSNERAVRNSPTPTTTVSCPILKVKIGKSVLDNFSSLAERLRCNSLPFDANGSVIELRLRDASSSECRSLIAAVIEVTDSLLKNGSYSDLVHTPLEDETSRSVLDYLLLGDCRPELAAEDRSTKQLVKLCVLTSICGWTPTKLLTAAAATPSSTLSNATSAVTNSGTSIEVSAATPSASNVALDGFKCDWCGRSFPFKYLLSTAVDPLFQHRGFCVWAHSIAIGGTVEIAPGWVQCAEAIVGNQKDPQPVSAPVSCGAGQEASSSSSTISSSGVARVRRESYTSAAEHAYKKIKSVLDSAISPRLSLSSNSRLSL